MPTSAQPSAFVSLTALYSSKPSGEVETSRYFKGDYLKKESYNLIGSLYIPFANTKKSQNVLQTNLILLALFFCAHQITADMYHILACIFQFFPPFSYERYESILLLASPAQPSPRLRTTADRLAKEIKKIIVVNWPCQSSYASRGLVCSGGQPTLYYISFIFVLFFHTVLACQPELLKERRLVCPAGFEPAACGLEVRRSIQLSYGHKKIRLIR